VLRRLKEALSRSPAKPTAQPARAAVDDAPSTVLPPSVAPTEVLETVNGTHGRIRWRLDLATASRPYMHEYELRGKGAVHLAEDPAVMIISRPLKDGLERQAFKSFTQQVQTVADVALPQELRWLSLYDEVGFAGPSDAFWRWFAVVAERRDHAQRWITPQFSNALMKWALHGRLEPQTPVIWVLTRGRVHLRVEHSELRPLAKSQAPTILLAACEAAQAAFGTLPDA
jgi:hypothetical protein